MTDPHEVLLTAAMHVADAAIALDEQGMELPVDFLAKVMRLREVIDEQWPGESGRWAVDG